jgi:hypothetical protein
MTAALAKAPTERIAVLGRKFRFLSRSAENQMHEIRANGARFRALSLI